MDSHSVKILIPTEKIAEIENMFKKRRESGKMKKKENRCWWLIPVILTTW
jgi:hypothetical protein